MKEMTELVFHGRGGQGVKTASELLAKCAMKEGSFIQAFPEYGPERAGAPVKAFTRISKKPIRLHCGIDAPDVFVVVDPTMCRTVSFDGATKNSVLLFNTTHSPEEIKKITKFPGRVFCVDATKISIDTIGANMPNTPMLGAVAKVTKIVTLNAIKSEFKHKFTRKIGEENTDKNLSAIERAFNEVASE